MKVMRANSYVTISYKNKIDIKIHNPQTELLHHSMYLVLSESPTFLWIKAISSFHC